MLFNFSPPPSTLFYTKQCRIHSSRYGYQRKCGNLEESLYVNSLLLLLLLLLDTHPLCGLSCFCAEVAQVVEQRTENPRVDSSTLSLGTSRCLTFCLTNCLTCDIALSSLNPRISLSLFLNETFD